MTKPNLSQGRDGKPQVSLR